MIWNVLIFVLCLVGGGAFAQTITIEPVDGVVTRGTAGTTQSVRIKRTGDTSNSSTVTYGATGSGTNPALATDFTSGFPAGSVTFAGDEDDPDCLVSAPAPAAALGMTRLDFCDGFKYDSIAKGSDTAGRRIGGKKKWTIERATFGSGTNAATDFTHFSSTGEMGFALTSNQYQSAIQTVNKIGANGYWIESNTGWYVEIRVKATAQGNPSQFAFWSMDTCHWIGGPDSCTARSPSNTFLEPDWLEYPYGQTALHRHKVGDTSFHKSCVDSQSGGTRSLPLNTYKTHGVLVEATGGGALRRFVDNVEQSPVLSPTSKCSIIGDLWPQFWTGGKYPLLLGGRVGDKWTVDYIRVWVKP